MVTYHHSQVKRQVRFLLPPPFIFLVLFLFCGSASAAEPVDLQHYSAAPDTLAVAVASPMPLAASVGGEIFGIYWSGFPSYKEITSIDGVDMTNRADGVQELATATFKTFKGVEEAISKAGVESSNWLELIYGTLQQQGDLGTVYTRLLELSTFLQENWVSAWPAYMWGGGMKDNLSIPDLLVTINRLINGTGLMNYDGPILQANGNAYGAVKRPAADILQNGFLGLAQLMFGDAAHDIHALDYFGRDVIGHRGSLSLADITGNGMQGLATLIGGRDDGQGRRAVWYWVDPADPNQRREYEVSSLFDLFFEIGTLQNSLAKLEYVYASKEDIDFKDEEKPNIDSVKDNFFGDGEGAVNPDQIKDVAGIGSDLKDAFTPPVSIGDFFSMISDSGSYDFFSQESASDMNPLYAGGGAAVVSEENPDYFEGLVQGDDGLWYPVGDSMFDLNSYLEGLS